MFEITVTNSRGENLRLTQNKDYAVINVEGLQPPVVAFGSSANATSDGETINSTKVQARNLVVYIVIQGDIEENRLKLYKYFQLKKKIKISCKNGRRDVSIEGYVETAECGQFTNREMMQVSIICPNPYWEDVKAITTVFGDITALFEFPFSLTAAGAEFSTLTANQRKNIINEGDVDTGIVMEIFTNGTVVNPIFYDVLKGQHMGFNMTLQSGDKLVINTNMGQKSIYLERNGARTNAIGYMEPTSDWLIMEPGDNIFTYSADSGATYMQLTFTTAVLYGGI